MPLSLLETNTQGYVHPITPTGILSLRICHFYLLDIQTKWKDHYWSCTGARYFCGLPVSPGPKLGFGIGVDTISRHFLTFGTEAKWWLGRIFICLHLFRRHVRKGTWTSLGNMSVCSGFSCSTIATHRQGVSIGRVCHGVCVSRCRYNFSQMVVGCAFCLPSSRTGARDCFSRRRESIMLNATWHVIGIKATQMLRA